MNRLLSTMLPSGSLSLAGLRDWLRRQFIEQKLNTPAGMVLLALLALCVSLVIATDGVLAGIILMGAIIGLPLFFASMFDLRFGLYLLIVVSFFLLAFKRVYEDVELGLIRDFLVAFMLLGVLVKQARERDWSFAKSPISVMVLLWMVYSFLQLLNPAAPSRLAWIYTFRSMAGLMAFYFVALYALKEADDLRRLFRLIFALTLLAAVYGIWQNFVGMNAMEKAWIFVEERRYYLMFRGFDSNGEVMFRIFSFLSDPVVLGVLSACGAVVCGVFMLDNSISNPLNKLLLGIASLLMLMCMVYTSTRTAFVLVPVGLIFYTMLTLHRGAIVASVLTVMMGVVLISLPTINADHHRIKTAFSIFKSETSSVDESYLVRLENQQKIQPFIRANPIGGGMGSTGIWGKRFSPWHPLADFPPDSGFVRIAVEQGWVGLLLYMAMLFVAMREGVRLLFRLKDPRYKPYLVACLTVLFMMLVGSYPQEIITEMPLNILFYCVLAVLVRIRFLDQQVFQPSIPQP